MQLYQKNVVDSGWNSPCPDFVKSKSESIGYFSEQLFQVAGSSLQSF
jgi:hypothetical protein